MMKNAIRPYPIIHIAGAVGARAAVLAKHRTARPVVLCERGDRWPIYAIIAGGQEIGRGHGTTDAWEQAAKALYRGDVQSSKNSKYV